MNMLNDTINLYVVYPEYLRETTVVIAPVYGDKLCRPSNVLYL